MDYIRELGTLVIAHRLKRLMESLLRQSSAVYSGSGLTFKPRWVSAFRLLSREGPMTVTALAEKLRLTHPAVVQLTKDMAEAGWITDERDPTDGRRRLLTVSDFGRERIDALAIVWRELASRYERLFREHGCDILEVLNGVEDELSDLSVAEDILNAVQADADWREPPNPDRLEP